MELLKDIEKLRFVNKTAERFWLDAARKIDMAGGQAHAIEFGTAEWRAWDRYFQFLRWRPSFLKDHAAAKKGITMPTRWSWEFDSNSPRDGTVVDLAGRREAREQPESVSP
jgi:hypothetical protein